MRTRVLASMIFLAACAGFGLAQTDAEAEAAEKLAHEAYARAWSSAVDAVTPEGYVFVELRRCAGCHDASRNGEGNTTHRNAIGISGDPDAPVVTGKGWLSGGHGRSQDAAIVSNTFCAWCHAPSQPGVTGRIGDAESIASERVAVSCIACHASEAVNERHGHYQANFRAGGDRDSLVDFVPRDPDSGVETNAQCLYCHLRPHGFTIEPHAEMLADGALRCIDCHMAVYNVLDNGVEERYHNMKVAANRDPATCRPCHLYEPERLAVLCADLVPVQGSIVHAVPSFEPPEAEDAQAVPPLPGFSWVVDGELAAMPLPGRSRPLTEDAAFLQQEGIHRLISLTEAAPDAEVLAAADITQAHIPVQDYTAPTTAQLDEFVAIVTGSVATGEPVGVHCTAGLGRSGTMAAAYLVATGASAEEAIATLRRLRPGSIETEAQEATVRQYEAHLAGSR